MLILSRKKGEKVLVKFGDKELVVRVNSVHGNSVKLSFHGPREIVVLRDGVKDQSSPSRADC